MNVLMMKKNDVKKSKWQIFIENGHTQKVIEPVSPVTTNSDFLQVTLVSE